MFKKLFLIGTLLFLPLVCLAEEPENVPARSEWSLLLTDANIDSYITPDLWKDFARTVTSYQVRPCSKLVYYHGLFSRMHEYEERHYEQSVDKEGLVGYRIWYNIDPSEGDGSEREREWKFKIIICDWDK